MQLVVLSCYTQNPSKEHGDELFRALKYIRGTMD